jgi:hypothetical protein
VSNFLNSISLFTTRRAGAEPQAAAAQSTVDTGGDGVPNTSKTTLQPTAIDASSARQTSQRSSKRGRTSASEGSERPTADSAQGPSGGLLPLTEYPVLREELTPQKLRQSRALNSRRISTSVALTGTLTSASHSREPRPTGPVLTGAERVRLQVMQVQLRLASLSLYEGPIDGVLSPETVTGVRHFQTLKGMRDTGGLAAGTLSALGVPTID